MKSTRLFLPLAAAALAGLNMACEEDVSPIGGSLTSGETHIYVDTIVCDIHAVSNLQNVFDARSGSLMLGNLTTPEYGALTCSFVTRLLPSTQLPDSIAGDEATLTKFLTRLDSCKVLMNVNKNDFTGDSLAPQKVTVFELTRQLPSDITNTFNPEGYYDPRSPLGSQSYTISNAGGSDSIFMKRQGTAVDVKVSKDVASRIFKEYVKNPQIFQWPQDFATFFPGFYVKPTFGKGCVANVSKLFLYAYFHTPDMKTQIVSGDTITVKYNRADSLCLAITAPEVLSSNRIDYSISDYIKKKVADGETIITTPGGYNATFTFPAKEVIEEYNIKNTNLSIISSLSMTIPASLIENDYSVGGAPYLLMVKTNEVEDFFNNNKIPDNVTTFYATYNSSIGGFLFSGLRTYLVDLMAKEKITNEDVDFTLVPVNITIETNQTNSYYPSSSTSYVTKCVPYTSRPSMMSLDTKNTSIVFSFSSQTLE